MICTVKHLREHYPVQKMIRQVNLVLITLKWCKRALLELTLNIHSLDFKYYLGTTTDGKLNSPFSSIEFMESSLGLG